MCAPLSRFFSMPPTSSNTAAFLIQSWPQMDGASDSPSSCSRKTLLQSAILYMDTIVLLSDFGAFDAGKLVINLFIPFGRPNVPVEIHHFPPFCEIRRGAHSSFLPSSNSGRVTATCPRVRNGGSVDAGSKYVAYVLDQDRRSSPCNSRAFTEL